MAWSGSSTGVPHIDTKIRPQLYIYPRSGRTPTIKYYRTFYRNDRRLGSLHTQLVTCVGDNINLHAQKKYPGTEHKDKPSEIVGQHSVGRLKLERGQGLDSKSMSRTAPLIDIIMILLVRMLFYPAASCYSNIFYF